ncbi:DoxX family protein [Streptomyces sp. NPDC005402]|uniref:DoxX family protein n=1 Tax=Streptomyces sp. NPDC005402 TaxID=3155338 RepID=UPI0033BBD02E
MLTPLAATGLVVVMVLAAITHARRKAKPAPIRRRALSAWSRTWSGPRRRETSRSPPGSDSPSCPGL